MKRYLKFGFDARVNNEIVFPSGSSQEFDTHESADRWVRRGAEEITADEYKKSKSVKTQAPPPPPPAPDKKTEDKKDSKVEDKKDSKDDKDNGL